MNLCEKKRDQRRIEYLRKPERSSVLVTEKKCLLCEQREHLDRHHCIPGTSMREICERYGIWVWLCRRHHSLIHLNPDMMVAMKEWTQSRFEQRYPRSEWMRIIRKNYLVDYDENDVEEVQDADTR